MKTNRIVSMLLVFTLACFMCVFVTADNPDSLKLGDTTGDGKINAGDALEILQYSVGKRTKFTAEYTSTDTDGGTQTTPPEPRTFSSLDEFHTWAATATVCPEGVDGRYFDYLRPGAQDMLLIDRFYFVPNTSDAYELTQIVMRPLSISFEYTDDKGIIYYHSFETQPGELTEHAFFEQENLVEYGGISYLVDANHFEENRGEVYRMMGNYIVGITIDIPDPDNINMAEIAAAFNFTRVDLPPLASVTPTDTTQ